MGDNTSGFVFFIHEPISYGYFHVLTSFHANPSSCALNCQVHHWHMMPWCTTSFALERWIHHTYVVITCNNDVAWSIHWTPPSLTSLMIYCIMSPIQTNVLSMGVDELEGWLWSFSFSTFGEVSSIVISPHILTTYGSSWWSSPVSSSSNSLS